MTGSERIDKMQAVKNDSVELVLIKKKLRQPKFSLIMDHQLTDLSHIQDPAGVKALIKAMSETNNPDSLLAAEEVAELGNKIERRVSQQSTKSNKGEPFLPRSEGPPGNSPSALFKPGQYESGKEDEGGTSTSEEEEEPAETKSVHDYESDGGLSESDLKVSGEGVYTGEESGEKDVEETAVRYVTEEEQIEMMEAMEQFIHEQIGVALVPVTSKIESLVKDIAELHIEVGSSTSSVNSMKKVVGGLQTKVSTIGTRLETLVNTPTTSTITQSSFTDTPVKENDNGSLSVHRPSTTGAASLKTKVEDFVRANSSYPKVGPVRKIKLKKLEASVGIASKVTDVGASEWSVDGLLSHLK